MSRGNECNGKATVLYILLLRWLRSRFSYQRRDCCVPGLQETSPPRIHPPHREEALELGLEVRLDRHERRLFMWKMSTYRSSTFSRA